MSGHSVSLHEAEGHLAELAERAARGDDVRISLEDGRVIKLVVDPSAKKGRVAGLHRGKIHVSDDFDEGLGEDFWLGNEK